MHPPTAWAPCPTPQPLTLTRPPRLPHPTLCRVLAQCSETAFSDSELAQLQQAQLMAQEMSGSGSVAHPQLAESINIWQNTRCRGQSCKLALPAHLQVGRVGVDVVCGAAWSGLPTAVLHQATQRRWLLV